MSESTKKIVVGVDIGDHACKITLVPHGKADVAHSKLMLSKVCFSVKERQFGESAKLLELSSDFDTVNCPKHIVGKSLLSLQNTHTLECEERFIHNTLVDVFGVSGIEVNAFGERRSISSTQLVAMFLCRLRVLATIISNSSALAFVISVPPSFDAIQKQAIRDAALVAGMDLLGIVDETTAIVLCHALRTPEKLGIVRQVRNMMSSLASFTRRFLFEFLLTSLWRILVPIMPPPSTVSDSSLVQQRSDQGSEVRYTKYVVFIDIGHSRCTASVVGHSHAGTKVLSVQTDEELGGRNIDEALVEYISAKFKLDLSNDRYATRRLFSSCQSLKEALSDNEKAELSVDTIVTGVDIHITLRREDLEVLIGNVLERVKPFLQHVLSTANVAAGDVNAVELLGGTTRVPALRRRIQEVMPYAPLVTTSSCGHSIAHGAALIFSLPKPDFDALGLSNPHGTVDMNGDSKFLDSTMEEWRRGEMRMFAEETEHIRSVFKNAIDDTPSSLLTSRSVMLEEEPILCDSHERSEVWLDIREFKLDSPSQVEWLQVLCDLFFGSRLSEKLALQAQMNQFTSKEFYGCIRRVLEQAYFLPEENYTLAIRLEMHEEYSSTIKPKRPLSTLDPVLRLCERLTSALNIAGAPEFNEEMVDTNLLTPGDIEIPGLPMIIGILSLMQIDMGESGEINSAVEAFRNLIEFTSVRDRNRPAYLSVLGGSLMRRFILLRQPDDIEESITLLGQVANVTPEDDPSRVMRINNLAHGLLRRFDLQGQLDDIHEATRLLEQVARLTQTGGSNRTKYAKAFSHLLISLRERTDESFMYVPVARLAVSLTPTDDPDLPSRLLLLGLHLWLRFFRLEDIADLEEGIQLFQQLVDPMAVDDNSIPCISILASMLQKRFSILGNGGDITEAIRLYRQIVQYKSYKSDNPPVQSPQGQSSLLGPQTSLFMRQCSNMAASASVSLIEGLRSLGLAILFQIISEQLGHIDVENLDESIEEGIHCIQKACDLEEDTGGRAQDLSCLCAFYLVRFFLPRSGNFRDLDRAVRYSQDCLSILPEGDLTQVMYLSLCSGLLMVRFMYFGEGSDKQEGIRLSQQAHDLAETQPAHDLAEGNKLVARTIHLIFNIIARHSPQLTSDHIEDDDQNLAISYLQKCAALLRPDGPSRSGLSVEPFRTLAFDLIVRYRRTKDVSDLSRSIQFFREVLDQLPIDSPYRARYLSNLSSLMFDRFELIEDECDRTESTQLLRQAISATPADSRGRVGRLLQFCYTILAHRTLIRGKDDADVEDVKQALLEAYSFPDADLSDRISTLLLVSHFLHVYSPGHIASLGSYEEAIKLFPQLVWLGLSLTSRLDKIGSSMQSVPCDAGACAIEFSQRPENSPDDEQELLGRAVQLIDQGRSVNWEQASRLHTDLEGLREKDSELADRLASVRTALNALSFQDFDASMPSDHDDVGEQRRELAGQWEELITSVRKIEGFEDFLAHPSEQLRDGVVGGYAVVVNASQFRCDALIIPPIGHGPLHLVPLPDISLQEIDKLVNELRKGQQEIKLEVEDSAFDRRALPRILNVLWETIVEPVVSRLEEIGALNDHKPCRIWWCPTGPLTFLPIHAAGCHKTRGRRDVRLDRIVSSYISTLSSLLRAQQANLSTRALRLLVVNSNQPYATDQGELEFAGSEIEAIRQLLPTSMFKSLSRTEATVERVLAELEDCNLAHFTCHGRQYTDNPAQSALLLHDGPLHISKISQVRSRHGMFAMLCACESAMGSFELPNEAMHISASFQFVGFHSVVATMWQIKDRDGPIVARAFYECLLKNAHEKVIDLSEAAYALHQAVLFLRDSEKNIPIHRWIPFIHVGL